MTLRFWASARSAAGTDTMQLPCPDAGVSVARLAEDAASQADDQRRLARVLETCAVLLGDRPVARGERAEAIARPGDVVEFLPPFAGG